jgi:hypothetical protein
MLVPSHNIKKQNITISTKIVFVRAVQTKNNALIVFYLDGINLTMNTISKVSNGILKIINRNRSR